MTRSVASRRAVWASHRPALSGPKATLTDDLLRAVVGADAENGLVGQSGVPLPPVAGTATPYLYLRGRQVLPGDKRGATRRIRYTWMDEHVYKTAGQRRTDTRLYDREGPLKPPLLERCLEGRRPGADPGNAALSLNCFTKARPLRKPCAPPHRRTGSPTQRWPSLDDWRCG
jgi:hypothetical protein